MTQQKKREITLSNILTPADVFTVLKQAMIALSVLTILSAVLFVWTREEAWLAFLRNSLISFVLVLGLIQLIKRGKTVLVAYLTLTMFGGLFIGMAWDGAGVRGLAYSMLVLVVIGSGLFLGRQTGFIAAVIFTLAGAVLVLASNADLLVNESRPTTNLSALLLNSVIFLIAAYMIRIALDQVERALAKAQHEVDERIAAEHEIQRLNLELEKRVSERTEELNASLELYRLRADEISLLHKLSNSLAMGSDLYETLFMLKSEIFELFPVDAFYVGIYHEQTDLIEYPIFFYKGFASQAIPRKLKDSPGLSGAVIFKNETLYLPDLMAETSQEIYHPVNDQQLVLHTFLGIPLVSRDKVIGLLSVQSGKVNAYTQEQIQLVENIARQAALAVDKAALLDELQHELQERKKLISELEAKNAELEQFTYTVSHDLRSPLVTIKGFLGLLEKDIKDNNADRVAADFKRIGSAADKMDSLLADLLELSRVGQVSQTPEKIDLKVLIQDALNTVEARLNARNVHVKVMPGLPIIYTDPTRLREVFENLFDNAVKYMGDQTSPEITVGLRGDAEELILFVQDNGMGIEPKYQENVFGLFNKLNPSSEGTGVGLAIVKRIIETQGGTIWVESEGAGKGSTFCFTIPNQIGLGEQTPPTHSLGLL